MVFLLINGVIMDFIEKQELKDFLHRLLILLKWIAAGIITGIIPALLAALRPLYESSRTIVFLTSAFNFSASDLYLSKSVCKAALLVFKPSFSSANVLWLPG